MQSLNSFLEHRIERVVAGQCPPIDLKVIARQSGVLAIEEREMIPEAVMAPEGAGFRIHLQNNFAESRGGRLRQRFSFAHEIAHTFFFELRDGLMKPRRDAPKGDRLEAACHKAAGLLLVPNSLLKRELRRDGQPTGADAILRLARQFEVSVEVMMRRLYEIDAYGLVFSPVLTRCADGEHFQVELAVYPPWLKALLPRPDRGIDFISWFGHTSRNQENDGQAADRRDADHGSLMKQTAQGILTAEPVNITPTLRIYELRLR